VIIPEGEYAYEIRDHATVLAVEKIEVAAGSINGVRRSSELAENRYEVSATLDAQGLVQSVRLRYVRGPFSRSASYEAGADSLHGVITAMGGRNTLDVKLGRFREIDGGLTIFKALLIAHVRGRGQNRWTARVTVIDPATLVAKSIKQSLYKVEAEAGKWLFEPEIGERETILIDDAGRILNHTTRTGISTVLT
jgi:hypothetical protein